MLQVLISRAVEYKVSAPSRLHFGLIDLTGDHGRIDGGAGVAIAHPRIVVHARPGAGSLSVPEGVDSLVRGLADGLQIDLKTIDLELLERVPPHVGLGSHTQLALAIGTALGLAADRDLQPKEIARAAQRGGTSGIGVNIFAGGGFIIDGGHSFGPGKEKEVCLPSSASRADVAPMLARYELPPEWRFAVVTPRSEPGAHGSREVDLFRENFPLEAADTGEVCRWVLMGLMPGAAAGDLELLGRSLTAIQQTGFKKLEVSLQPKPIMELGDIMVEAGASGAGLSSFGPTVYALAGDETRARAAVDAALAHLEHRGIEADGWITPPDNQGVRISRHE